MRKYTFSFSLTLFAHLVNEYLPCLLAKKNENPRDGMLFFTEIVTLMVFVECIKINLFFYGVVKSALRSVLIYVANVI